MATWIIHLRIAEKLFHEFYGLEPKEFFVGAIAPDCGIPNENWTVYTPDKSVSHFTYGDNQINQDCVTHFADKYLNGRSHTSKQLSFYLGYYVHLATDVLWKQEIVDPLKITYASQLSENPEFIWTIKKDWYDLDRLYLKKHPDCWAYKEYKAAQGFQNDYMWEFAKDAFADRQEYITKFYQKESQDLNRTYKYLSEDRVEAFIEHAVDWIGSEECAGQFVTTKAYMQQLPSQIKAVIGNQAFTQENIGCSGSRILRFENHMVLKVEAVSRNSSNEYCMMSWLNHKLVVPKVLVHIAANEVNYLLMSEMEGNMACDKKIIEKPEKLIDLLTTALKQLWQLDITECPSNMRLQVKLAIAKQTVEAGEADCYHCEPDTYGEGGFKDPSDLYQYLVSHQPKEDLVFCHGDFCLPNIMVGTDDSIGFIDLGNAGIADRYQDIALCLRSLRYNLSVEGYGDQYTSLRAMFFEKLGIIPDETKIKYYYLLDELF